MPHNSIRKYFISFTYNFYILSSCLPLYLCYFSSLILNLFTRVQVAWQLTALFKEFTLFLCILTIKQEAFLYSLSYRQSWCVLVEQDILPQIGCNWRWCDCPWGTKLLCTNLSSYSCYNQITWIHACKFLSALFFTAQFFLSFSQTSSYTLTTRLSPLTYYVLHLSLYLLSAVGHILSAADHPTRFW